MARVMAEGSEEQQINIAFGRPGSAHYAQSSWGNTSVRRPFREADVINMLIESSAAKLQAGTVISLHPAATTKHATACIADTYVIGNSGAVPLYRNPFDDNELFVVS
jgi:hypothetical protein